MKLRLTLLLVFAWHYSPAIEGNDDNFTRDYYVEKYKTEPYISDFTTVFNSSAAREDYKKLREYLNSKQEIERMLRMAGDEYYYGLSFSRLFAEDYIQSLEDQLESRDATDRIWLRLNSETPRISYNGEFSVESIQSDILPAIKDKYQKAVVRDSLNQAFYTRIQENIGRVQQDIFLCEQALGTALAPEFRQQSFRIWISLTFSLLIAMLLCVFFFIMYRRSDRRLASYLLSETGLQFITIFVLIIAIILFGILNILQGSELAAILSGISGYILGKGGKMPFGSEKEESSTHAPVSDITDTDDL